jgi:hypothetical protein
MAHVSVSGILSSSAAVCLRFFLFCFMVRPAFLVFFQVRINRFPVILLCFLRAARLALCIVEAYGVHLRDILATNAYSRVEQAGDTPEFLRIQCSSLVVISSISSEKPKTRKRRLADRFLISRTFAAKKILMW